MTHTPIEVSINHEPAKIVIDISGPRDLLDKLYDAVRMTLNDYGYCCMEELEKERIRCAIMKHS